MIKGRFEIHKKKKKKVVSDDVDTTTVQQVESVNQSYQINLQPTSRASPRNLSNELPIMTHKSVQDGFHSFCSNKNSAKSKGLVRFSALSPHSAHEK